jgi:hypothetical protein
MSSQTDLDQGGTHRQTQKVYLGPSVGWQNAPMANVLNVTEASVTVARGMNLIQVSRNGTVTINLPSSLRSAAGAQAIPFNSLIVPVVIVDAGGFASPTNIITINAFAGELIDGLAAIEIVSSYGAYVLKPNIDTGGWTLTQ